MSVVDDLKRKIQSLNDQLSQAQKSLQAALEEEFPIKRGDRIKNSRGKVGIVESIKFFEYGTAWIRARKVRKDGTVSDAVSNFYSDYEKVSDRC